MKKVEKFTNWFFSVLALFIWFNWFIFFAGHGWKNRISWPKRANLNLSEGFFSFSPPFRIRQGLYRSIPWMYSISICCHNPLARCGVCFQQAVCGPQAILAPPFASVYLESEPHVKVKDIENTWTTPFICLYGSGFNETACSRFL